MKKSVLIISSIVMILVFVAIMGSGGILKRSMTSNDDVLKQVNLVQKLVTNKAWNSAEEELKQGIKAWEKVKNRIQFSVERDVLEEIDSYFGEFKGAIKARDTQTAIIVAEKIKYVWQELES